MTYRFHFNRPFTVLSENHCKLHCSVCVYPEKRYYAILWHDMAHIVPTVDNYWVSTHYRAQQIWDTLTHEKKIESAFFFLQKLYNKQANKLSSTIFKA